MVQKVSQYRHQKAPLEQMTQFFSFFLFFARALSLLQNIKAKRMSTFATANRTHDIDYNQKGFHSNK